MSKLLAGIIGDKLCLHLKGNGLLANKLKQWRKTPRGTKDQLVFDKVTLRNCWRRLNNLSMAWIDY